MESLGKDWITDGIIDFEYKKYVLLAYMQHVDSRFHQHKLYPVLAELVDHYRNLDMLQNAKSDIAGNFNKSVSHIDWAKLELKYRSENADTEELKSIEEIISFALPHFIEKIEMGKEIHEFVEQNLSVEPIGVIPMYRDEGYLFLQDEWVNDVLVYHYQSTLIESSTEKYRSLKTEFILREKNTLSRTFEQLKLSLTRKFKDLPNPATWLVHSQLRFPLIETYLPVTKRLLMRELHRAS